jgi:hypothetical protein
MWQGEWYSDVNKKLLHVPSNHSRIRSTSKLVSYARWDISLATTHKARYNRSSSTVITRDSTGINCALNRIVLQSGM